MRGVGVVFAAALVIVPLSASASLIANEPLSVWYANGDVLAVAASDDSVYVGGTFSLLGRPTGSWVRVSASGQPAPSRPFVDGSVAAAAPDGRGGWFLVGSSEDPLFVDGVRRAPIAHVTAGGALDRAWQPRIQGGGVAAIALRGATLFIAGDFTRVGGKRRISLAALDARTGRLLAWRPRGEPLSIDDEKRSPAAISDIELSPNGRTLYAVGDFERIGGREREGAAALSTPNAAVTTWNPRPSSAPSALAVSPTGDRVYVQGYFSRIGGARRDGLAALDSRTGRATTWRVDVDGFEISALLPLGDVVYLAGDFESLGGRTRHGLAAVNARTGAVTSWEPSLDAREVTAVAVSRDRGLIYVAGAFNAADGEPRDLLAAVDVRTGELADWDPRGAGEVAVLVAMGDGSVFVGGNIGFVGGERRAGLASFTAEGAITPATATIEGTVRSLALSPDGARLYVGGAFAVDGVQARNLALVDPRAFAARAWGGAPNSGVWSLAPSADGRVLFIGGAFVTVANQRRTRLAALDAVTGDLLGWNSGANQLVRDLMLDGSDLYVAGDFSSIGGLARRGVARLDAASGAAEAWDARSTANVHAVAARDGMVAVGGGFSRIGGRARNSLAMLDAATGDATTWDPNPDEIVRALALHPSAPRLTAAGDFTKIGSTTRVLAEFAWPDGTLTSWAPRLGPESAVAYSRSGTSIVAGGSGGFVIYR